MHNVPWKLDLIQLGYQIMEVDCFKTGLLHLMFPQIWDAVGDDVEVILDGSVRRGLDVVKALVCGADSLAIGRAYLFGLAAGGYNGVDKALPILSRDIYLAMGPLGC